MKKKIGILACAAAIIFSSCEPLESRQELKGATTMDKVNNLVSVTAEMRNGKRSNYTAACRSYREATTK